MQLPSPEPASGSEAFVTMEWDVDIKDIKSGLNRAVVKSCRETSGICWLKGSDKYIPADHQPSLSGWRALVSLEAGTMVQKSLQRLTSRML